MIHTVEEAIELGLEIAGTQVRPDFVFSSRSDMGSSKNSWCINDCEYLLNNYFKIARYSKEKIKSLTYIFILLPPDHKGVDWKERKKYSRNNKILRLEIKFPEYERFCRADKPEVLRIMAEQTLRGSQVFLPKEKDFDFPKFYADLSALFKKQGWIDA